MAIEEAREHLKKFNYENKIIEFSENTATVELAASIRSCVPSGIMMKTLSPVVELMKWISITPSSHAGTTSPVFGAVLVVLVEGFCPGPVP